MTDQEMAQLRAVRAQAVALVQQINGMLPDAPATPRAAIARPARCEGQRQCALVDDEARTVKGTFADPQAWECRGCGATEATSRG